VRVKNGKAIYTGKDQIERVLSNKDEEIRRLRSKVGTVAAWADAMRDKHLPYISGTLDTSLAQGPRKADVLCAQIKKNLWCSECSTPWPCKALDDLNDVRCFALDRMDEDDEEAFKTKIREMKPKQTSGQIQTHL